MTASRARTRRRDGSVGDVRRAPSSTCIAGTAVRGGAALRARASTCSRSAVRKRTAGTAASASCRRSSRSSKTGVTVASSARSAASSVIRVAASAGTPRGGCSQRRYQPVETHSRHAAPCAIDTPAIWLDSETTGWPCFVAHLPIGSYGGVCQSVSGGAPNFSFLRTTPPSPRPWWRRHRATKADSKAPRTSAEPRRSARAAAPGAVRWARGHRRRSRRS